MLLLKSKIFSYELIPNTVAKIQPIVNCHHYFLSLHIKKNYE
jgi:hypothetical protein